MNAVLAAPVLVAGSRLGSARAIVLLGWREGRRMLTRPVYVMVLGGLLLRGTGSFMAGEVPTEDTVVRVQELLLGLLTWGALFTLFAASLVATSARRTGAESQFDAAPLDPQLRTLATGLGVLFGPVAVASLVTFILVYVERGTGSSPPAMFVGWEYVQLPLIWLGAGLLGLAVARWLPWPGVPLAVFVGLIAWTLWSAGLIHDGRSAGFLMPFVITSEEVLGLGTVSAEGQLGWHAVYLLGLCLLALAGALLRYRPIRDRTVLGFGLLAAVLTASA